MERRGGPDVFDGYSPEVGVPRNGTRWPSGLVHCEAKLVRRRDGQPWFIHGVGFDITDLKQTEQALQKKLRSASDFRGSN